jgi:hypothetical protein
VELLFRPLVAAPATRDEPTATEIAEIPVAESETPELPAEPETPVAVAASRFAPDPMLSRTKRPSTKRSKAARERLRARRAAKVKAGDYGVAGVILFVIIGLIVAGGYMVLKDHGIATRSGDEETPADAAEEPHTPLLSSALVDSSPKPLPARLLGVWELRTDDDRNGTMEFRADGTATFLAWVGDQEQIPTQLLWAVVSDNGNELTIELGNSTDAPGYYRFRLLFTDRDAFTIIWKIEGGIEKDSANRFIRRATG